MSDTSNFVLFLCVMSFSTLPQINPSALSIGVLVKREATSYESNIFSYHDPCHGGTEGL